MDAEDEIAIVCSNCGCNVASTMEMCPQCGASIAIPPSNDSKQRLKQLLDRPWVIVVLLLHVGLLGIPVYWKTNYSLGTRLFIVVTSIVYTIGAVACILVMLRKIFELFIVF